jgi:hypothetical protein
VTRGPSQPGNVNKFVPPATFGPPERERHPIQERSHNPDMVRLLAMQHRIESASPLALSKLPALEAAIKRADVIEELRAALTDQVMDRFLPLMNTALGFRTDRGTKKAPTLYSKEEVRTCFVEALLLGLRLTDNEWNIISGRCYVTVEGFTRLLRDHPGLTDLKIDAGVPMGDRTRGVTVAYQCSWRLNGVRDTMDVTIPVRGDEWATLDQLLGKAARKIRHRIYTRITGSLFTPEGAVDDMDEPESKPSDTKNLIDSLKAARPAAPDVSTAPAAREPEPEKTTEPVRPAKSKGDANAEPTAEELAASSKDDQPWDDK